MKGYTADLKDTIDDAARARPPPLRPNRSNDRVMHAQGIVNNLEYSIKYPMVYGELQRPGN